MGKSQGRCLLMSGSGRGFRAAGATLVTAVFALALCACTGGPDGHGGKGLTVHWDLRKGHSVKQVKWYSDSTAFDLNNVQLTLQLPGHTFTDRVDSFGALNESGQISVIDIDYPGAKLAPAYTRARRLAQEWKINPRPLDTWYATQRSRPSMPDDQAHALAVGFKPTGPGGPVPSIEIIYSFDDATPNIVQLEFAWTS